MGEFFIIYIIASVVSLIILYAIIKAAVKNAIVETQEGNKEVEKLLRSILVKMNGNLPELAKIDNALETEFKNTKTALNKKLSSDKNYYSKVKELQDDILKKEYNLKSALFTDDAKKGVNADPG